MVTSRPRAWSWRRWARILRSRLVFAFVPVGAEVGEPGFGVREQVPDDGEDGAGDGALGPVPAQPPGQAAESFAEEGFGAGGAVGGLGAVALEVGVAVALRRSFHAGGQPACSQLAAVAVCP